MFFGGRHSHIAQKVFKFFPADAISDPSAQIIWVIFMTYFIAAPFFHAGPGAIDLGFFSIYTSEHSVFFGFKP